MIGWGVGEGVVTRDGGVCCCGEELSCSSLSCSPVCGAPSCCSAGVPAGNNVLKKSESGWSEKARLSCGAYEYEGVICGDGMVRWVVIAVPSVDAVVSIARSERVKMFCENV